MTKFALVTSGVVFNVVEPAEGFTIDEAFHPDFVAKLVQCPDDVEHGWSFDDGVFRAPEPPTVPLSVLQAARISALTVDCAAAIVGGYQSSALGTTHTYPSGVTDQINMMGSVTASLLPNLAEDWTTPFWCADEAGVWHFRLHSINEIRQAGSDGKMHVVACQATLDAVTAMVTASTSIAAVEAVAWPSAT